MTEVICCWRLWVRMLLGEGDGEPSLPQGCGVKRIQAKTQNVRKPYCALVSPSPLTRHSLHSHSAKSSRARVTAHNQCERKSMMELLDGSKCSNSRLEILRGVTKVTIPLRSCCGRPPGPPPGAAARRGRRGSWRSRPKPATRWGRHYELSVAVVVVGGSWCVGNKRSRVGGVCYCCCPVGLARWRCQRRGPCESEHSRGSWAWKTQSKAETFGGRRGGQVGRGGENKKKEGKQERQGGRGGGGDVEGGSWNEEGRGTAELDACKIKDGDVIRSFGLQTAQQSDTRLSRTSRSKPFLPPPGSLCGDPTQTNTPTHTYLSLGCVSPEPGAPGGPHYDREPRPSAHSSGQRGPQPALARSLGPGQGCHSGGPHSPLLPPVPPQPRNT